MPNELLGLCLGLSLVFIGAALTVVAKRLVVTEELEEDYPQEHPEQQREIAEIVHEADLHDGKFTRNESTGVDLTIRALAEATADDHDLLAQGMAIFDGLYAVLKPKA